MNKPLKKHGFSLIEVVVALSLLMMVMAATISLIITVVNLNLAARSKTEAVAYAQDGITQGVAKTTNGCFIFSATATQYSIGSARYYRTTTFEKGTLGTEFVPGAGDYIRIISKVQWYIRSPYTGIGADFTGFDATKPDYYEYRIIQIVKECNE